MNVLWMLRISWWYCGIPGTQPRPVLMQCRFTEHANTRREEEHISQSIWDLARIQISRALEMPLLPVENNSSTFSLFLTNNDAERGATREGRERNGGI